MKHSLLNSKPVLIDWLKYIIESFEELILFVIKSVELFVWSSKPFIQYSFVFEHSFVNLFEFIIETTIESILFIQMLLHRIASWSKGLLEILD